MTPTSEKPLSQSLKIYDALVMGTNGSTQCYIVADVDLVLNKLEAQIRACDDQLRAVCEAYKDKEAQVKSLQDELRESENMRWVNYRSFKRAESALGRAQDILKDTPSDCNDWFNYSSMQIWVKRLESALASKVESKHE